MRVMDSLDFGSLSTVARQSTAKQAVGAAGVVMANVMLVVAGQIPAVIRVREREVSSYQYANC